jgi:hypothetical protein
LLDAGHRQCAGRLGDRAGIVVDILDRGAGSSLLTVTTSSTQNRHTSKPWAPICATATPSAKVPTLGSTTRASACSAAFRQAECSDSTPMIVPPGAGI